MIPNIDLVESIADDVLRRVPEGLVQGKVSAGLYGAGFLGRWALPRLRERGVKLASCHDANETLSGSVFGGLPVHAACDLKATRPEFMIITARHAVKPVSALLAGLGILHVSYDAWHVASDFAAFRQIHDCVLGDDRSKEVLRSVLLAMLTGESDYCGAVFEPDQYFCLPQFRGCEAERFVDAGAFDGDSAEKFIGAHPGGFSKIYAFEPGQIQFAALKSRTARLIAEWSLDSSSIELINAGLGDGDYSTRAVTTNGQLTNFAPTHESDVNGAAIDIVSLDKFLREEPITFLKADVEGMEMELLRGARSTIRRHRPKIAVCVYHYPADIPEIANYLRDLVPDYRFALRHHSRQLMETVLYCWAEGDSGHG